MKQINRPQLRIAEQGFTLIEIAVSVAIVLVGLTALIVLQTSHMSSFFMERNLVQAGLLSKRVITMIEVSGEVPELGNESGDIKKLLNDMEIDQAERAELETRYKGWSYEREVSNDEMIADAQAPGLEDVLRRIDLHIRWGEAPGEEFHTIYYMRTFTRPQL